VSSAPTPRAGHGSAAAQDPTSVPGSAPPPATPEASAARPVYLLGGPDPVFGLLHPPAVTAGDVAVLICPPFGNADLCSYRSRRHWAQHLAAGGHATLRIDLPGSGDSGGGPRDPERLQSWTRALGDASQWLRGESGARRVVAIGIGLSGLLACRAVAEGAPIDDLVLWGAPARGRTYLRELRAFSRLEASWSDADPSSAEQRGPDAPDASLPAGFLAGGGFTISAETAQALEALDLTELAVPDAADRRVLMLERDGIEVDQRLLKHLRSAGAAVTVAPGPGYGQMMAEPYESRSPIRVFALLDDWLSEGAPAGQTSPAPAPTAESGADDDFSPIGDSGPTGQLGPTGGPVTRAPRSSAQVEINVGAARIRETPVEVEQPFGRLLGVLAEPVDTPMAQLGVVILNAGALRRIGPNRMWVEAARRWSARGVPSLRIDLAGIGDADGDDTGWQDDASFYVPEFVDQARAALDVLVDRGLPDRFVLVGLCSGAYWAFHAALQDERVVAAFMVNPRALFWDGRRSLVAEAANARKLRSPRIWLKLLRGELSPERVLVFGRATAALLARLPARLLARWRAHRTGGDRLDHALNRLLRTGKHAMLVFGPGEPLRAELEVDGRLTELAARPNVDVEYLAGDREAHTLEPIGLQVEVHRILDRALERELARHARS
jgi:alpha-beta hydrolase superfamily lysophospholipase